MVQPVLSPFLSPQSWDSITVGGLTWGEPNAPAPGLAAFLDGYATQGGSIEIDGAERFYSWDPKHGKGQAGHTPTFQGNKPKPFRLIFKMWTDSQFFAWQVYQLAFQYDGTKIGVPPTPVAGGHPSLALLGISAIYCNSIGEVKKLDDRGMFASTVTVTQYLPPPPVNVASTPTGAITIQPINVVGTPPNPALAALQQQRDALAAQAASGAGVP